MKVFECTVEFNEHSRQELRKITITNAISIDETDCYVVVYKDDGLRELFSKAYVMSVTTKKTE